jgi:hypothetical protein
VEKDLKIVWRASKEELDRRERFFQSFRNCPIPDNELLLNLGLFMSGPALARLLFMDDLYKKILNLHGSVMEFGVRWGQNLVLWSNFRALYEPYNYNRTIIGFDTFEGFPSVHEKDSGYAAKGGYTVVAGYEKYLEEILDFHEQGNPVSHIKKYQLRKGDAIVELEKYLKENPHTIIALAYFDFDIYEPTKVCLEMIQPHLTRGSVIGFDELNQHDFPGETIALKEVLGLSRYRITRSPYSRVNSYLVIE